MDKNREEGLRMMNWLCTNLEQSIKREFGIEAEALAGPSVGLMLSTASQEEAKKLEAWLHEHFDDSQLTNIRVEEDTEPLDIDDKPWTIFADWAPTDKE